MSNTSRNIRDCNVAVVGGAGFLGSHLVNHLIKDRNCKVTVIDNLVVGKITFVNPAARFIHHDITESELRLRHIFEKTKIEFCFNYAAYPYIPDSFERPLHVFNVNAFGALKVINAAQEAGVKAILQVSSAEIYGNGADTADYLDYIERLNEASEVIPHSSYGASKAAIDALIQVRWKEAKTPCIALRQFNCIGERETHPYVVPEIIQQLYRFRQENKVEPIPMRKQPPQRASIKLGNNSLRDFQYAGDAVRMATELLEYGEFGQVYNMGSTDAIRIYKLAELIGEIMGFSAVHIEIDQARVRPWEIWALNSDNTKLYNTIKARPQVSLREALEKTVAYFYENGCKWDW